MGWFEWTALGLIALYAIGSAIDYFDRELP